MTCASCGAARAEAAQRFCGQCGAPFPAGTSLARAGPAAPDPGYVPPWPGPPSYGRTQWAGYGPAGAACPMCHSRLFSNHYTVWHVLVGIFLFPFGLLFLLAPVRRCENMHRYGLGLWLINVIKVLLALTVAAIAFLIWVLISSVHDLSNHL